MIKKIDHIFNKIVFTGIWLQPCVLALLYFFFSVLGNTSLSLSHWLLAICFSILIPIYVYLTNLAAQSKGKEKFGLFDAFESTPTPYHDSERAAHIAPVPPEELLSREPDGFVLGKYKGDYVRLPFQQDFHTMIIGASGSGKTSLLLNTLLANPNETYFAIDIKQEIAKKSFPYGKVVVIDPNNRTLYGYDIFYALRDNPTNQKIAEECKNIADALIPMPANIQDPFWKISARNLLTGLLIYYFKNGTTEFIDIVSYIMSAPIVDIIKKAVDSSSPTTPEYRYLIEFYDLADRTLSCVHSEMANQLVIFVNDADLRYALKQNPLRANPTMLSQKQSIFYAVKENKLTAYYNLSQVIISQVLTYLCSLPEKSYDNSTSSITVLLDELARFSSAGRIAPLLESSTTARSRHIHLICLIQDISALRLGYSQTEIEMLMANCGYILALAVNSPSTAKTLCSLAGKYTAKKVSWNGTGKKRTSSTSYEQREILSPDDLVSLPKHSKSVLITPYGYYQLSTCPYYKNPSLLKKSQKILAYNTAVTAE